MNSKQNLLIIGSGMYVTGRGTNNFGTIYPAALKALKYEYISSITISCSTKKNIDSLNKRIFKINKKAGFKNLKVNTIYGDFTKINTVNSIIKKYKLNIAIISVPINIHFNVLVNLMNNKVHCLITKPLVTTKKESSYLVRLAKKNKLVCQVEFHKRLDESNLVIKDKIKNNKLGEIFYSHVSYSQQKNIPIKFFKNWSSKTNVFEYLGVHYVDIIYFITGFKPISVCAYSQSEYLASHKIKSPDSIHVIIEWKKPNKQIFISTFNINWIDPIKTTAVSDQKISIIGSKGRIDCEQKKRGIEFVSEDNGPEEINPYFSSALDTMHGKVFNGYGIRNILKFIENIKDFEKGSVNLDYFDKTRPTFNNCGNLTSSIIENVNKSLRNNNKKYKIA